MILKYHLHNNNELFSCLAFGYLIGHGQKLKFTISGGMGLLTIRGQHVKFPLTGGSGGSVSGGGGTGGTSRSITINGQTYYYKVNDGASMYLYNKFMLLVDFK